ncbi:MAG: ATP-binding protein, partial [Roseiflexaceae bacterium]
RGDLLPGWYDDWVLVERERLRHVFLAALERLVLLLEQQQDYGAAINYAQRLLRHDPLHETTYQHLMRLHALSGDRASALRVYHTCATLLERELAVEPSPATCAVYEHLVHGDLLPAPSPPPPARARSGQRGPAPAGPATPPPTRIGIAPLVGRQGEWAQLQAAWQATATGGPHMVVLAGEAGIGKTRLAEELLDWAGRQGLITASARCYAAEGELVYAPVTAWLRTEAMRPSLPALADVRLTDVARLLPELLAERPDLPHPGPLTEAWQRQRLFESLARATLGNQQPRLLLLDDLQWCDAETLAWLHYLLRFDPRARLLLIGTVRPEELAPDHPLTTLLQAGRRSGQVTELALEPLDAAGTAALAAHVAGRNLDPVLLAHLHHETEGNPLFVVETVRAGALAPTQLAHTTVGDTTEPPGPPLPPVVQAVLAARLAQLSPAAREVASLAATIGRAFTFAVLARASDADEPTLVRGLDELWQRRIVREQGEDAYDFSHDKLREVAYAELSAARRRRLHRRVAEALEATHTGERDAVSGQVAAHYERAGLPAQAIPAYQRAAEVARRIYANQEAIAHFQRALALLEGHQHGNAPPLDESQPDGRREVASQLYESLGDVLELTGQHDAARAAYQAALAQLPGDAPIWHARLQRKIGTTWVNQSQYDEALRAYRIAEISLGQEPAERALEWWQEWVQIQLDQMWLHYTLAQVGELTELVEKSRSVVERYGTPAQRGRFFWGRAQMAFRRDRFVVSDEALTFAHTQLAASEETGSLGELASARFNVGFCHLWRHELAAAEEQMQAALSLAEQTGDITLQSRCLTYLTISYRTRGQVEAVRRSIARSLAVATAGQMIEYLGTANANLAWVAWRAGDLAVTQEHGRAALELWRQASLAYPFQWVALWPLIGVALAQDQLSEAISYARALLTPVQQRLPDALMVVVEEAVQAWDRGQPETAHARLRRAIAVAQEMGYL